MSTRWAFAGRLSWMVLAATVFLVRPEPAHGETAALPRLVVDIGEAQVIHLPAPAQTVFVADPTLADVQVGGPRTIIVFGVRSGRTTFYALDQNGRMIVARDVRINHNLDVLNDILKERFPGQRILLTSAPNTLMVEGSVGTPQEAQAVLATIRGVVGDKEQVIDRLKVDIATQVSIRVRIAEVSKSIDQRLGINWQALFSAGDITFGFLSGRDFLVSGAAAPVVGSTGIGLAPGQAGSYVGSYRSSNVSVDTLIDALDQEGLARTLAEPNLTAISGQKASFLAGGEFPIPIAQGDGTISVDFKQFGVALDFVPTVLSSNRMSLTVRPEVSELSNNGSVQTGDLRIPALTVRRVETTVELGSGQSLVIGGLLQQNARDLLTKLPGLGDLPVIGALFTSSSYQKNETELVVIVTPYIVKPASTEALETPLGRLSPASPFERLLLKGARVAPAAGGMGRLTGRAGFVY
ncbi:type II and III secretion system protein family protein [Geminicoccus roseus]|uniref:type II and III secretion system protein family protein n=1 Tax=Geminicoccus roseus TaxID=404900 RepID=UPI00146FB333|nr:type II and III secretion system protein family protein [Geminicoccus roseus]